MLESPERVGLAEELAARFQCPLLNTANNSTPYDTAIVVTADSLGIQPLDVPKTKPLFLELLSGPQAYRFRQVTARQEMILRAIAGKNRVSGLSVFDATGGFARDALIIALAGAQVTLCERNPIVFLLLEDAINRAEGRSEHVDRALARMQCHQCDALRWLTKNNESIADAPFDVVYLDPMFPARGKSAKVKKDMQLLQRLTKTDPEIDDDNEAELLSVALRYAQRRVVVKRPRLAPTLAGRAPDFNLTGRSSRFDVYLC